MDHIPENHKEIMMQLEALGNERMRLQNTRRGASGNQFGVRLGEIRKLAKKIKHNPEIAEELWDTTNIDARLLAILLLKPKDLSIEAASIMVASITFVQVSDWFSAYILKKHHAKESIREKWVNTNNIWQARAGWYLLAESISKDPETYIYDELLNRIEEEMGHLEPEVQWTMNSTLVEIGINHPKYRERAIEIGETLGIYRDYPVSKGCTSPFAPIWINEMVRRQTEK